LNRESVGEWDESLYATSAWEMTHSGNLVGTTFDGTLDYYNSKPPLNVWLIAVFFSWFGTSLFTLRLASATCGWLTVWVLQRWTKRAFGPVVSLVSSLVLASAFGFLHEHAARSGNADAPLTLLFLLAVVVMWTSYDNSRRLIWLGPILAGVFLLKGLAVLQPLLFIALVGTVATRSARAGSPWKPLLAAAATFLLLVSAWLVARWRVDGWHFFRQMVAYDLLGTSLTTLEGHAHGPLYYFDVLQRYHYEWLSALLLVGLVARRAWRTWVREVAMSLRARQPLAVIVMAWVVATVALPTVLQTRIAWYLNPFYPLFATLVGLVFARALEATWTMSRVRQGAIWAAVIAALVVAESKTIWRLYRVTNLDTSVQGLLLSSTRPDQGQRVFRDRHVRSEAFVVRALCHAEFRVTDGVPGRPADARPGDLVVREGDGLFADLRLLGRADGHSVYQVE